MKKVRIIPRLDVKGPNVVKGIHLEGLRVVGKPAILAKKYYEQGADEILYIDIVASLYERKNLIDVVKETTSLGVHIPITVGGGVRTIDDISQILRAGADKVAINTAATKSPEFISEASNRFGAQCIVGSIEAKKINENKWEAYRDNGREKTGLDAIIWSKKLVNLGVGEILITSIDTEGVQKGFDLELLNQIVLSLPVPVIISGGAGNLAHIKDCVKQINPDAISIASILHYNRVTIKDIKNYLNNNQVSVRSSFQLNNTLFNLKTKRKKISIVDYGLGNLKSVIDGFHYVGNEVEIINSPESVQNAELLVLPGVGAFADGMDGLKERNLINPILKFAESKKPLLGICLGMQLLMSESEEFGNHRGLDLIKGKVIKFKDPIEIKDKDYRIPHIGWNSIYPPKKRSWEGTVFADIPINAECYFVHSFYPILENENYILADTVYSGQEFCSVLKRFNIYGTQFHPEKSGDIGLKILDSFGSL